MVALGQEGGWRITEVQLWTTEIQALLKLGLLLLTVASSPIPCFCVNLSSWSSSLFQAILPLRRLYFKAKLTFFLVYSGRPRTCLYASIAKLDVCFYSKGSCSVGHYLRLERCLSWTQKTKMIGILSLLQLSICGLAISQLFWSKGSSWASCWGLWFPILVPGWQSFREHQGAADVGISASVGGIYFSIIIFFCNGSPGLALTAQLFQAKERSYDAMELFLFPEVSFLQGTPFCLSTFFAWW